MRANEGMVRAGRYVERKGVSELLYGAVVSGSVLAVSSAHATNSDHVVVATAIVTVAYWLAHVYVDAVGGRAADVEHHTGQRLLEALRTNTGVLLGAVPPLLAFIVARAFGSEVADAALIALVFTVLLLVVAGFVGAYRAGARGGLLLAETAISGAFGAAVIGLKFAVH